MYSDTLFATTVSRRGNIDFGWLCLFATKLKSEIHEALSLPFQYDGVPPVAICDNAKEMVLGKFNRKLKVALCHLK